MNVRVCDFETTTTADDCRVWAWAKVDIETLEHSVGTDIDSFMQSILSQSQTLYFHNLKFDGNFIVYWLFKNGYTWDDAKDEDGKPRRLNPKSFTTCISDMGAWYSITIQSPLMDFDISYRIEIRDSLKIIPLPVEAIPKAYGLTDEQKGSIEYTAHRDKNHELTEEEKEYVISDARIVAKAVSFLLKNGQCKLTAASNALADFKNRTGKKEFNKLFPPLTPEDDAIIRKSYKGGWTYVNPKYRNVELGEGCVYDVNSMYPWAMRNCVLPYGVPVRYFGEPQPSKNFPLYTVTFDCTFNIKPGKYPSIQLKHTMGFSDTEYLTSSMDNTGTNGIVTLTLTSVDFELFKECYDYEIFSYKGGYYFKGKKGMFTDYIDYWYNVKTIAKREGNKGMEAIAKLMLNSLYGKFGSRIYGKSKEPYYDEIHDIVRYKATPEENRRGVYIPVATFITSYCRDKIIRAANACGDRFVYGDTDSLHIIGKEDPDIEIDEFRLGAFKQESVFKRAKFIRQKTYMEIMQNGNKEEINLKACGMPKALKKTVREEDFFEGAVYDHSKDERFAPKLKPKVVPGGVILEETTFRIKGAKVAGPGVIPPEVEFTKKVRKPLTKRKK